jgi:hypothetical protein
MREPTEPVDPGEEVTMSLSWADDNQALRPGARVEATDGVLGTVRERRRGTDAAEAVLAVATSEGVLNVPERLVRETRGDVVMLSLPLADVRAQSSAAADSPGR